MRTLFELHCIGHGHQQSANEHAAAAAKKSRAIVDAMLRLALIFLSQLAKKKRDREGKRERKKQRRWNGN
jgi:hypothetical protein